MLPALSVMRRHKAKILKGLHDEGINFESLKKRLLALPRSGRIKKTSPKYIWEKILQGLRVFSRPRGWVPAAVVVTALLLMITLPLFHHPENPYLTYLSSDKLPYQPQKLRGEMASQAERFFHKGMNEYIRGNYKGAIGNLREAVEKVPDNGTWWLYLGVCYYLDGQGRQATEALTRADTLTQYSQKVTSRWYLAEAHLLQGHVDRAIPLLEWVRDQKREYATQADSLLTIVHSPIAGEGKE